MRAWEANYRANMYHQPADEYSPDWDFTGMAQDAELLHAVGLRLANSCDWPNWSAGQRIPRRPRPQRGRSPKYLRNGAHVERRRARIVPVLFYLC